MVKKMVDSLFAIFKRRSISDAWLYLIASYFREFGV
jgi:hypothetical protein